MRTCARARTHTPTPTRTCAHRLFFFFILNRNTFAPYLTETPSSHRPCSSTIQRPSMDLTALSGLSYSWLPVFSLTIYKVAERNNLREESFDSGLDRLQAFIAREGVVPGPCKHGHLDSWLTRSQNATLEQRQTETSKTTPW